MDELNKSLMDMLREKYETPKTILVARPKVRRGHYSNRGRGSGARRVRRSYIKAIEFELVLTNLEGKTYRRLAIAASPEALDKMAWKLLK